MRPSPFRSAIAGREPPPPLPNPSPGERPPGRLRYTQAPNPLPTMSGRPSRLRSAIRTASRPAVGRVGSGLSEIAPIAPVADAPSARAVATAMPISLPLMPTPMDRCEAPIVATTPTAAGEARARVLYAFREAVAGRLAAVTREEWLRSRTFAGAGIDPELLRAARAAAGLGVSVVRPALEGADNSGAICGAVRSERRRLGQGGSRDR